MPSLKVAKVAVLPAVVEPNMLYFCQSSASLEDLVIYCTDETGTIVSGTVDKADVVSMVDAAVMKAAQPAKEDMMDLRVGVDQNGQLWSERPSVSSWVQTDYLPDVGDVATVRLGEQIVLMLRKTGNGGNETYRSEITAFSQDRMISYRRDSVYDGSSTEGSNANDFVLQYGVTTTVDATVYGSMRDFARVVFVDMVTLESWIVQKFHFGKGYFRAVVQYQRDPNVPSATVPLPVYP